MPATGRGWPEKNSRELPMQQTLIFQSVCVIVSLAQFSGGSP